MPALQTDANGQILEAVALPSLLSESIAAAGSVIANATASLFSVATSVEPHAVHLQHATRVSLTGPRPWRPGWQGMRQGGRVLPAPTR